MLNTLATIVAEERAVTVIYGDERVQLESAPQNFNDFDSWVRSRFGFPRVYRTSYLNSIGKEVIPGATYFAREDYIELICKTGSEKTHSMRNDPAPSVVLPTLPSEWFHLYGSILVLLIAIIMAPHFSKYVAFFLGGQYDMYFMRRCKDTFIDCYVNFLCWSSTYLFIRRYLNPETSSVVFKKFSCDAFYGGLAAASTAFMKPILSAALHT